jgi:hypothetical protein
MDLPEKQLMRELEKALREIERLRQENARLRRKLGMEVSESKSDYNQSGLSSSGPGSRVEETHEARSYEGHGLSTSSSPRQIESNFSTQEKLKLFRALFRGREDIYPVFWSNERTGKKGYSPACEDPWSSRKGKPKKYLPLTDEVIFSHLMLIRLFQQDTRYGVRGCRARLFPGVCANFNSSSPAKRPARNIWLPVVGLMASRVRAAGSSARMP